MIVNVDPVAHVFAVAVQRNLLFVQTVGNNQRQKFFGKLSWPIVVAAARDDGVESESVASGAHEMFGGSFRSSVRTVWRKRRRLSEKTVSIFGQTAHHFIRRDVHETFDAAFATRV